MDIMLWPKSKWKLHYKLYHNGNYIINHNIMFWQLHYNGNYVLM